MRSFVTVLLIYIYGTPPCTHAFPDVCQEMRGSWGGERCKVTKTMIL